MKRVVIVGTTGCGKSTLAQQLAECLHVPHVDLDTLHWEPGWQEAPINMFRERVCRALAADGWVVGGNYGKVRDIIWPQADTLIWLDYPLWLSMWWLFWRTIRRIVTQENLWGTGNYETWRTQFFSRDSLFIWAVQSHPRHRRTYPQLLAQPEYAHLRVLHFRWPRQTQAWLESEVQAA